MSEHDELLRGLWLGKKHIISDCSYHIISDCSHLTLGGVLFSSVILFFNLANNANCSLSWI